MGHDLVRKMKGSPDETRQFNEGKAGADESMRVAREWIKKNASDVQASPPAVSEGSVIVETK